MKKPKVKIKINNKMKAFGQTDVRTGVVEINRKKHKNNKKELADTIKHEIYHIKHPKASEKSTIKNTGKLENMSNTEQNNLIAKLRHKKLNYQTGVIKRKLKMKGEVKAGSMIEKMNEQRSIINTKRPLSKTNLAILGMV
jgi:hypothetical protein